MSKKPLLIIVEGPQGIGKTTITNHIREQLVSTNLFRLSGCKSDDVSMPYIYHKTILEMIDQWFMAGVDSNIVMDRSFITELVYRRLGYKGEDKTLFTDEFYALTSKLLDVSHYYNIKVVNLFTRDTRLLVGRLMRDKPSYATQFSSKNSEDQMREYGNAMHMLTANTGITVQNVDVSIFDTPQKVFNVIMGVTYK